ncbi:uroporphyrinogen-III C-methyltransferase [Paraferrimonas sp. SM1919]|uniref:uroporphyrinogen-III C-methyltransferase n=1 Tax=Paraferrimonas sp. SM1919 TaxID=2662263 RepID=UPI0013D58B97|nr:uroporphyrinogen-III C-methyltransferase [Paraferrimonas sp. SM1919]
MAKPATTNIAKVDIVGAGPGDPELLTLKAFNSIKNAQVILFDYLVSPAIRQLFPATAESICVGKAKGSHSLDQDSINQLMINKAKQGLRVCRLKGGDPFIFGRGAEEMLALKQAGITSQCIAGVSAATGASTSSGFPLTHRGISQGCTMITAHAEKELTMNWQALATLNHTLVFYMGLTKANVISSQLRLHGLCANTPTAIIYRGSQPQQQTFHCHLKDLSKCISQHKINSPALIVVGEVTHLAEQLSLQPTHIQSEGQPLPITA